MKAQIIFLEDGETYVDHTPAVFGDEGVIETGLFTADHRKVLRKVNPRGVGFRANMDAGPAYVASGDVYEPPEEVSDDADQ